MCGAEEKYGYIEKAAIGTIIAFVDENGKARSAAIVSRDTENKIVNVITEFNKEFNVPYEKVLWVKNGPRFPRGVYNMLKRIDDSKESAEVENNGSTKKD